jgi:hypothetical protein
MSDKQIQDRKVKIESLYGNEAELYNYLFITLDNFYYRYLETTLDKNLKTTELSPGLWGARSRESSMVDALKITNPLAKPGIIELAKTVPKIQGPLVEYELSALIKELKTDHGEIHLKAIIRWGFPNLDNHAKQFKKEVIFKYDELQKFRKELALKLEEVCEAFL